MIGKRSRKNYHKKHRLSIKDIVRHPVFLFSMAGLTLILIGAGVAFAFLYQKPEKVNIGNVTIHEDKPTPKPVIKHYSLLTGAEVASEADVKKLVTAIMIENSPEARPQSGLKDAETVYEAIAEGGITRFLALYQQEKPQLIGPVRSLRMYYVDWLTPYQPSVAHVGGSANSLREIRNGQYRDIDQFFNGGSYWRSSDRWAPHNVYTSFEKLDALNNSRQFVMSDIKAPLRVAGDKNYKSAIDSQVATKIDVAISGALFNSHYDYNEPTKTYLRSQAGLPHNDREKGQLEVSVVAVLRVNMHKVMEDGYREDITTSGEGEANIFQGGRVFKLKWKKDSRSAPLQFFDMSGKEFKIANGKLWVVALPNGGGVSWQ